MVYDQRFGHYNCRRMKVEIEIIKVELQMVCGSILHRRFPKVEENFKLWKSWRAINRPISAHVPFYDNVRIRFGL